MRLNPFGNKERISPGGDIDDFLKGPAVGMRGQHLAQTALRPQDIILIDVADLQAGQQDAAWQGFLRRSTDPVQRPDDNGRIQ